MPSLVKSHCQVVGLPVEVSVKFTVWVGAAPGAAVKLALGAVPVGGVLVSPVRGPAPVTGLKFAGFRVKACDSVASQPVIRLRTVMPIGVGSSCVPLGMLSPLPSQRRVVTWKLGGVVGTVATMLEDVALTMCAEAPSAPPKSTRSAL